MSHDAIQGSRMLLFMVPPSSAHTRGAAQMAELRALQKSSPWAMPGSGTPPFSPNSRGRNLVTWPQPRARGLGIIVFLCTQEKAKSLDIEILAGISISAQTALGKTRLAPMGALNCSLSSPQAPHTCVPAILISYHTQADLLTLPTFL